MSCVIKVPLCPQVVFLALSYATVYMIYMRHRGTYDSENDSFRVEFLLVPVIGLSLLENYAFTPLEVSKRLTVWCDVLFQFPSPNVCGSFLNPGPLDLLDLLGVCGHHAAALHDHQDGRGRVHHHPLPVLPWPVPSPLYRQLAVALPHRELL